MLVMFSTMAKEYVLAELEELILSVAAGDREALARLYSRTRRCGRRPFPLR